MTLDVGQNKGNDAKIEKIIYTTKDIEAFEGILESRRKDLKYLIFAYFGAITGFTVMGYMLNDIINGRLSSEENVIRMQILFGPICTIFSIRTLYENPLKSKIEQKTKEKIIALLGERFVGLDIKKSHQTLIALVDRGVEKR